MNRRHFLKFIGQGLFLLAVAPTKLLPTRHDEWWKNVKVEVEALDPIIEIGEFRRVPGYEPIVVSQWSELTPFTEPTSQIDWTRLGESGTLTLKDIQRASYLLGAQKRPA